MLGRSHASMIDELSSRCVRSTPGRYEFKALKTSEEPQRKCACLWDASLCVSYALLYPASNEKPVLKLEKLDSKA